VSIVPTTLQRIEFTADQVTRERVGVQVTGIAVYRVAEPLLAFRVLNFTYSEAASEKLAATLREMFVGAARRLIANLSLEECLTRRKEAIAGFLMDEISPVVSGEGSPHDTTTKGWGVVLDTIEIQDVRVLSAEVFQRLQAPYREKLALEALVAEDRVVEERARLEAERRRAAEQARRELMVEEEARMAAERRRAEEARRHDDELAAQRLEAELARARRKAEADRERALIDLAARREAGETEAALLRMRRAAHEDLTEARLREIMMTETMPELARAFRGSFDRVHVTSTNGGDPFAFLTAGIDHVVAAVRDERKPDRK
jgi:regulator of protease activity HflC (stomatin/prohibitin superfamily)